VKTSFLVRQKSILARRPLVVGTLINNGKVDQQLKVARRASVDVIELRLDTFTQAQGPFQKTYEFGRQLLRRIKEEFNRPVLLTLRAHRLLMEADVIVHDALVPEAVVAMGRRDAERLPVGKRKGCHSKSQAEINALLVELGQQGKRVVRLKSGDPLVFGRAGEEMAALRDAGIAYEVVPGVTAAFAAAADFELPLTLRGVSSSMVFTTGHDLKGNSLPDWAKLAISGATVAVYMGRSVAAEVAGRLIEAGLSPDTAVAVVENASLANRRRFHGTLADLPSLEARGDLSGPVMTIIGDAVAGANFERSEPLAAHRNDDLGHEGAAIAATERVQP